VIALAAAAGFQGDRWKIVPGCTCLWSATGMGWDIIAEDVNCPAHHPDGS
jgi:hypothetical protein